MLPGKLNLFHLGLASLISGFLRATQLFRLNPLSSLHTVHVEMLLVALANTAPRAADGFPQQDFTKSLSEVCQHTSGFQACGGSSPAPRLAQLFQEREPTHCIT